MHEFERVALSFGSDQETWWHFEVRAPIPPLSPTAPLPFFVAISDVFLVNTEGSDTRHYFRLHPSTTPAASPSTDQR